MTPNLIELIVQAVKEAGLPLQYGGGILINEDNLRTALASIPEMPQVDVANVVPYQLCPKCNGDGDLGRFNSPSIVTTVWPVTCDVCNGSKIIAMHLPSPPTTKGAQG